jgi:hypothetical protein
MTPMVLWSALFARERGVHPKTQLLAVAVVAAVAGVVAARTLAAGSGAAPPPMLRWLLDFDAHAALLLGLAGVLRLLARPAEDQAAGWVTGYVASGGTRQGYALGLWGAVAGTMIIALLVAVPAFGIAKLAAGGGTLPLGRLVRVLLFAPLVIASMCAAAAVVGTLARDTAAATALAFLLVALPLAAAAPSYFRGELSQWAATLLFLHLPPRPPVVGPGFVLQHAAYILVSGAVLVVIAERVVARRA